MFLSYLVLVLVALWVWLPDDGHLLCILVHVRLDVVEDGQRPRSHVPRGWPACHATAHRLHHHLVREAGLEVFGEAGPQRGAALDDLGSLATDANGNLKKGTLKGTV